MNLAPVVMFVYNRADHFKQTFEALNKCPEAKNTDLFIFSDGPKSEEDREKVQEVRNVLREVKNLSIFKKIEIIESIQNKGLASSVIHGVTDIINRYGRVIVVEDDSVTSVYFLSYMNRCLEYYESQKSVGAIAGYTPQLDIPDYFRDDIFFAYRSCSCAWATWSDRWKNVDWELENMKDFYRHPSLIQKLNSNGSDRFIRLYRQTKGNGSSWSVRFGAHLVKQNQMTVYPRYSYIQNIGCDESGVHSKSEDAVKMQVNISNAIENPVLCEPKIDKRIQKVMKKHYSSGLISEIKRVVATSIIVLKENIMR